MERLSKEQQYEQMRKSLNEKQWRQDLAMEAKERGNLAAVAREAKVRPNTIRQGIREIEAGDVYNQGERIRKEGGGRKPLAQTDETLLADLEDLLQPKGDPMSQVQWTSQSLSHLVKGLSARGHTRKRVSSGRVAAPASVFRGSAKKKTIEGKGHPDRNAQFEHSTEKCKQFKKQGDPEIAVDCKKKELLGNFKNNGREWQAKGEDMCVNVYDFVSSSGWKGGARRD